MSNRIIWTEEQVGYLREHWAQDSLADIAYYLRISPGVVKSKARELGLQKSEDWSRRRYYNRYVRNYSNGKYGKWPSLVEAV